jgi:hypothetical protein
MTEQTRLKLTSSNYQPSEFHTWKIYQPFFCLIKNCHKAVSVQKQPNGLAFDRILKDKYLEVRLSEFCYIEYPELADEAISVLMSFSITHLCKAGVQLQLQGTDTGYKAIMI